MLLLSVLALLAPAHAFGEDLCYPTTSNPTVHNCYETTCVAGSPDASCYVDAVADGLAAMGNGRSMVHFDAVYFLAQAVGFASVDAYWIAAYDQAVDEGRFVPYDAAGAAVDTDALCSDPATASAYCPFVTVDIDGFDRMSPSTGGTEAHFFAPYNPAGAAVTGVSGLTPNPDDTVHELMLANFVDWAWGSRSAACTVGITTASAAGDYSTGSSCYSQTGITRRLTGSLPIFQVGGRALPIETRLGVQKLTQSGVLTSDLASVEPHDDMARLGIYLHVLQDRVSHHVCGDASYIYGPNATTKNFDVSYSPTECTQELHAYRHVWEVGYTQSTLPAELQTLASGLEATWGALGQYASDAGLTPVLTHDEAIGVVMEILQEEDPATRQAWFEDAAVYWGLAPLPW